MGAVRLHRRDVVAPSRRPEHFARNSRERQLKNLRRRRRVKDTRQQGMGCPRLSPPASPLVVPCARRYGRPPPLSKQTSQTDRVGKHTRRRGTEFDYAALADGCIDMIVRTAGAKRTRAEIKRDYEYLQRLWEQIRELTLKSTAPAKIYEEGDLIKRSIRDLYNRDIDEIHVEGETGYREAKGYMKMLLPSHAKNVKLYQDPMPLYARYQVDSFLAGMFNPTVQLRSGGYIVIGITEALVAIDVNSGRATKEGSIEDTALKTNLEASEEIARQLRLRDLAGLIVIDFIDMEERRNNLSVEKRLKDSLKSDRARLQLGRISGFGLLEMSRQRLRPGMLEATTTQCAHCYGNGYVRSDESLALSLLREIEEEGVRNRSKEVLLRVPISVANYLLNQKREHIATIEARYGLSVRVESDMHLISPDHTIETFKTATRILSFPTPSLPAVTMDPIDDADVAEEVEATEDAPAPTEDGGPRKRNRRRRRKRGGRNNNGENANNAQQDADAATDTDTFTNIINPAVEELEQANDDYCKIRRDINLRKTLGVAASLP